MKNAILLSIAALALTACGDGSYTLTPDEQIKAENGAIKYSQAAKGEFLQCSGLDSNGDHYVTCTYTPKEGGEPKEITCAYQSVGCKQK